MKLPANLRVCQYGLPLPALLLVMSASVQASPSIYKEANFDTTFSGYCAAGTVGGNNPCEYSAVELKRGQGTNATNGGTGGNAEMYARTATFGDTLTGTVTAGATTTSNTALQSNALPWNKNSTDSYSFDWRLEGNPDASTAYKLTISAGGSTWVSLAANESSFVAKSKPSTDSTTQLWMRLRTLGTNPGSLEINKIFDGTQSYSFAQGAWQITTSVSNTNPYLMVSGVDFSDDWYIEGSATLDMAGGTSKENPAINWKFTETLGSYTPEPISTSVSTPVPEPTTLLMLGAGLVVLARRRTPAAT